jgi:hypothetical protein
LFHPSAEWELAFFSLRVGGMKAFSAAVESLINWTTKLQFIYNLGSSFRHPRGILFMVRI